MEFEEFLATYTTRLPRFGVTEERYCNIFTVSDEYSLGHCVATDLLMYSGISMMFRNTFGRVAELRRQRPCVGKTLELQVGSRYIFYLVTRKRSYHQPTYNSIWDALHSLRSRCLTLNIKKLAIPKLVTSLDELDWEIIRSMIEVVFRFTAIEILVCLYNSANRSINCYFHQKSTCRWGDRCHFRHEQK